MPTIPESLATAVRHHQAGQLQQAEQIYRQILQEQPEHPDALHFLGVIAHQVGRNEAAIDCLRRAIVQQPDRPAFHCSLATVYTAVGKPDEAEASCRRALQIQPDYAQGHNNLGIALQTRGMLDEAIASYRRALEIRPDLVEALNNLGTALQAQGKLDEAVESYRRAVQLRPGYVEAHSNLGNALKGQGRLDEAVASYRRALEIRPEFAEVHDNLGTTLHDQGQLDEAVASFQQALQIRPEFPEAHNDLGYAYTDLGRFDEAMASFQRALQLRPEYPEAHNNLGMALKAQGQSDQAAACFQRALQIRPHFAEAHSNLGAVLQAQGRHEEAVASFRRALQIRPDFVEVLNNLGLALEDQEKFDQSLDCYRQLVRIQPQQPLWELRIATLSCPDVLASREDADRYRRQLEADVKRLSAMDLRIPLARLPIVASKPPFYLMYHGLDDRPIKEAYAGMFRGRFPETTPTPGEGLPRIGFLVTKGHEGIFLRCMQGVLERLDPQRFQPVVICSSAESATIRHTIQSESIRVLVVPERFDQVLDTLRAARFHLLYYWEVGSDTTNYFLPFFRLAPVQCTSWGLPVTSGIPQVDYYLSDELVEAEDADKHYSERLVRAATLLTYQQRVSLPDSPRKREHFGFSTGQHVYLCAQNVRKIHPGFDPILAAILRRDPRGVLVLVEDRYGYAADKLRGRFAGTITEAADRIVFLPRQPYADYLGLIAAADVLLDPLHFGGGVTTYDAFSLNQPIVTLPSEFRRGRFTLGCYRKMGVTECVAADQDDYVEKAVRLGSDAEYRAGVVEQIRRASPLLFEDQQAVREYERVFQELLS